MNAALRVLVAAPRPGVLKVTVSGQGARAEAPGVFVVDDLPAGHARIVVAGTGVRDDVRNVVLQPGPNVATFSLVPAGRRAFRLGGRLVASDQPAGRLAVIFREPVPVDAVKDRLSDLGQVIDLAQGGVDTDLSFLLEVAPTDVGGTLAALRAEDWSAYGSSAVVGPALRSGLRSTLVARPWVIVELLRGDREAVRRLLADHAIVSQGLEPLRGLPHFWRVHFDDEAGDELLGAVEALQADPRVVQAEIGVAGVMHLHGDGLADDYEARQWANRRIHAPEAWALGASGAGVRIRVVDRQLPLGLEGRPISPDLFDDDPGAPKFMGVFASDGAPIVPSGDSAHGIQVAAIACARDDGAGPQGRWPGFGIRGVAPDARWAGVQVTADSVELAHALWNPDLPDADVVVVCGSFSGAETSGAVVRAVELLALEGRRRRGALLFVSAGNEVDDGDPTLGTRPWPLMISCGAVSATDGAGFDYPPSVGSLPNDFLDVCAPSYSDGADPRVTTVNERLGVGEPAVAAVRGPVLSWVYVDGQTWLEVGEVAENAVRGTEFELTDGSGASARRSMHKIDEVRPSRIAVAGTLDLGPVATVTLTTRVIAPPLTGGAGTIALPSSPSDAPLALFYRDGARVQVRAVTASERAAGQVAVPAVASEAYLCEVLSGISSLGGTSSATPQCAGVGALLLSRDPSLSMVEARAAIWRSATRYRPPNTADYGADPARKFGALVAEGHCRETGFGVVDACAAVLEVDDRAWRPDHRISAGAAGWGGVPQSDGIDVDLGPAGARIRVKVTNTGGPALPGTHVRLFVVAVDDALIDPPLPTVATVDDTAWRPPAQQLLDGIAEFFIPTAHLPAPDSAGSGRRWRIIAEVAPHDGEGDGETVASSAGNAAQRFLYAPPSQTPPPGGGDDLAPGGPTLAEVLAAIKAVGTMIWGLIGALDDEEG